MSKGKIIQVMGPVVDVAFEDDGLPHIKDALVVDNQGKKCVMEVAQHVGGNVVRCIMLASSDGLCKDMEVEPTGAGIQVPVGEKTLGRLFNVLGETIDGGETVSYTHLDVYKRQAKEEGSRSTPYYKSVRIQEGDSLWEIARQYREGSSMSMDEYVNQLRQMNGLKKDTIHTGQYLTVVYFE